MAKRNQSNYKPAAKVGEPLPEGTLDQAPPTATSASDLLEKELSAKPAIPQLPTRLDLFTAAALTGILSHNASIPPTTMSPEQQQEALVQARAIAHDALGVFASVDEYTHNARSIEQPPSQPEATGTNS